MKFEVVGIDCPCVDLAVNVDVYPDSNGCLLYTSDAADE